MVVGMNVGLEHAAATSGNGVAVAVGSTDSASTSNAGVGASDD